MADIVDQFVARHPKHIDEDGYYGAQCWDVVACYAREVWGCPSFPTGSGGAEGLYRLFQDPIPQYFDRVQGGYQKGDVIVWQGSFSPPWGHTALCLDFDGTTLTVFEQNGNNPDGDPYVKTRSLSGVSGALRPKQNNSKRNEDVMDKNDNIEFYRLGLHREGSDEETNLRIGQKFSDAANPVRSSDEWQLQDHKIKDYDNVVAQVDELVKSNSLKDQRIADLQKQTPGSDTVEQPVVTPDKRSLWQVIGDFLSQFKKG